MSPLLTSSSTTPAQAYTPPTNFSICRYPEPVFPTDREPLKRTHNIRVASLMLSAHHPAKLELFAQFAWHSAQSLGIPTARPAPKKKHRELITVPKAPFIHKKYQENFERRHHHREIVAYDANRSTIDLWLRYLSNNSVAGVGMRATVHEWVDAGFGQGEVEFVKAGLEQDARSGDEVVKVAERLMRELGVGEEDMKRALADAAGAEMASQGSEKPAQVEAGAASSSEKQTPTTTDSTTPAADASEASSTASESTPAPPAQEGESVNERSVGETESALAEDLPIEAKQEAKKDTETEVKAEQVGKKPTKSEKFVKPKAVRPKKE